VGGVAFIVGIDRFMSEARALTNFTGNAVATVLIGTWTREIDRAQVDLVLDRHAPFDEATMMSTHLPAEQTDAVAEPAVAPAAAPQPEPALR